MKLGDELTASIRLAPGPDVHGKARQNVCTATIYGGIPPDDRAIGRCLHCSLTCIFPCWRGRADEHAGGLNELD